MKTLFEGREIEVDIPCSHCGKNVYENLLQVAFVIGEAKPFCAIFCSVECAHKHDPTTFDAALLSMLNGWMNLEKQINSVPA